MLAGPVGVVTAVIALGALNAAAVHSDAIASVRGAVVLVVAFAIGALGLALTAGLALVLRRSR
jgi:hypothetical protein